MHNRERGSGPQFRMLHSISCGDLCQGQEIQSIDTNTHTRNHITTIRRCIVHLYIAIYFNISDLVTEIHTPSLKVLLSWLLL